ncbi:hypothetical protein BDK51DRAFT_36519 [Blyttiomyces helicus]|uniref:Uncharacterized protein n=1 Tax=Blyttiomyces helicus TaxID=388810 RepID=A0A4P9WI76_9FUNG|nr:hypothetical protein BDK51DRAFT_36519 [Blyttiomyces helicus]|eukprot:RKO90820.1 hypothetical protein BDK51DRAFT_36519 [Blyttiomyces helicus]
MPRQHTPLAPETELASARAPDVAQRAGQGKKPNTTATKVPKSAIPVLKKTDATKSASNKVGVAEPADRVASASTGSAEVEKPKEDVAPQPVEATAIDDGFQEAKRGRGRKKAKEEVVASAPAAPADAPQVAKAKVVASASTMPADAPQVTKAKVAASALAVPAGAPQVVKAKVEKKGKEDAVASASTARADAPQVAKAKVAAVAPQQKEVAAIDDRFQEAKRGRSRKKGNEDAVASAPTVSADAPQGVKAKVEKKGKEAAGASASTVPADAPRVKADIAPQQEEVAATIVDDDGFQEARRGRGRKRGKRDGAANERSVSTVDTNRSACRDVVEAPDDGKVKAAAVSPSKGKEEDRPASPSKGKEAVTGLVDVEPSPKKQTSGAKAAPEVRTTAKPQAAAKKAGESSKIPATKISFAAIVSKPAAKPFIDTTLPQEEPAKSTPVDSAVTVQSTEKRSPKRAEATKISSASTQRPATPVADTQPTDDENEVLGVRLARLRGEADAAAAALKSVVTKTNAVVTKTVQPPAPAKVRGEAPTHRPPSRPTTPTPKIASRTSTSNNTPIMYAATGHRAPLVDLSTPSPKHLNAQKAREMNAIDSRPSGDAVGATTGFDWATLISVGFVLIVIDYTLFFTLGGGVFEIGGWAIGRAQEQERRLSNASSMTSVSSQQMSTSFDDDSATASPAGTPGRGPMVRGQVSGNYYTPTLPEKAAIDRANSLFLQHYITGIAVGVGCGVLWARARNVTWRSLPGAFLLGGSGLAGEFMGRKSGERKAK